MVRLSCACALLLALGAAAAPPDDQEQARSLVRTAREAFDAGDFARAADLLGKARALAPTAATLYNLGRALERAGDLAGAETAYRDYLAQFPAASDRGAVEATIADLQRRLAEARRLEALERERTARPATEPIAVQPVAPAPRPLAPRLLPWALAGVGVVGFGAAIGFGVSASSRHAAAQATRDIDTALATQAGAESFAHISTALYIAAGVALGAAILWLVIQAVRSSDAG